LANPLKGFTLFADFVMIAAAVFGGVVIALILARVIARANPYTRFVAGGGLPRLRVFIAAFVLLVAPFLSGYDDVSAYTAAICVACLTGLALGHLWTAPVRYGVPA
jgi:hypothetical protein